MKDISGYVPSAFLDPSPLQSLELVRIFSKEKNFF